MPQAEDQPFEPPCWCLNLSIFIINMKIILCNITSTMKYNVEKITDTVDAQQLHTACIRRWRYRKKLQKQNSGVKVKICVLILT